MSRRLSTASPVVITAIQLGLLLFWVYYTFIGGQTAQGIYDYVWRRNTLVLVTGLAAVWLAWRGLWQAQLPRTPVDGPLLALAGAWLLAGAFSVNLEYSLETLVFWFTYIYFFYMAADLGRRRWLAELMVNAIMLVSGLVLALAGLQLWWWFTDAGAAAELPRLSVLGNPNTMASFLALVAPLVMYKLTAVKNPVGRVALAIGLALLAAAALLTQSRGGALALAVGGGLFAVALLPGMSTARPKLFRWGAAAAALLLAAALIAISLNWRGATSGLDIRQQVMTGALITWRQHPLLGSGPGTLGQELLQNQPTLDQIWPDAHNLYLTLLAETGLAGVLAVGWLLLAGLNLGWANFGRNQPANRLAAAGAASLAGFAAHNLVDSQLKFPAIMALVAVLAGLVVGQLSPGKTWGRRAAALALLALAVVFGLGWRAGQNIKVYNLAVAAAYQDDWPAAAEKLAVAQSQWPDNPFLQRQLAFALGMQSAENPAARRQAIALYQSALAVVERLAIDHANLACLLWAEGDSGAAIRHMERAYQLEPGRLQYRLNLGNYLAQTGQAAAAAAHYQAIDDVDRVAAQALAAGAPPTVAQLEAEFNRLVNQSQPGDSRYATEVARRRPLPADVLPCLQPVYLARLLAGLTLAEGQALESAGDFGRAGQAYRRLLALLPQTAPVQEKLIQLCRQHPEACEP